MGLTHTGDLDISLLSGLLTFIGEILPQFDDLFLHK
jgi:hypothetical protein